MTKQTIIIDMNNIMSAAAPRIEENAEVEIKIKEKRFSTLDLIEYKFDYEPKELIKLVNLIYKIAFKAKDKNAILTKLIILRGRIENGKTNIYNFRERNIKEYFLNGEYYNIATKLLYSGNKDVHINITKDPMFKNEQTGHYELTDEFKKNIIKTSTSTFRIEGKWVKRVDYSQPYEFEEWTQIYAEDKNDKTFYLDISKMKYQQSIMNAVTFEEKFKFNKIKFLFKLSDSGDYIENPTSTLYNYQKEQEKEEIKAAKEAKFPSTNVEDFKLKTLYKVFNIEYGVFNNMKNPLDGFETYFKLLESGFTDIVTNISTNPDYYRELREELHEMGYFMFDEILTHYEKYFTITTDEEQYTPSTVGYKENIKEEDLD